MSKVTNNNNSEQNDDFDIEDFKDFRNNDISCDRCGKSLGCTSDPTFVGNLCDSCVDEIEEKYKKLHPEEYSD